MKASVKFVHAKQVRFGCRFYTQKSAPSRGAVGCTRDLHPKPVSSFRLHISERGDSERTQPLHSNRMEWLTPPLILLTNIQAIYPDNSIVSGCAALSAGCTNQHLFHISSDFSPSERQIAQIPAPLLFNTVSLAGRPIFRGAARQIEL